MAGGRTTYAGISLVRWLENKETRTLRRDGQTETDKQQLKHRHPPQAGCLGSREAEGGRGRWIKPYPVPCPSAVELGISRRGCRSTGPG